MSCSHIIIPIYSIMNVIHVLYIFHRRGSLHLFLFFFWVKNGTLMFGTGTKRAIRQEFVIFICVITLWKLSMNLWRITLLINQSIKNKLKHLSTNYQIDITNLSLDMCKHFINKPTQITNKAINQQKLMFHKNSLPNII